MIVCEEEKLELLLLLLLQQAPADAACTYHN
jgi:hypothetical protein